MPDPITSPSAVTAQPLPPLPDLSAASAASPGAASTQPPGFLSALMSGILPVKQSVDAINAACKQIVQSGAIPGSESICSQIVALATSLLPMAAQSVLQPMGGMGGMGGVAGAVPGGPMPPPPGGPQPILSPQG